MKTRKIFIILFILIAVVSLQAQQGDEEMKMLFNKKENPNKQKMANGGYGGIVIGYTQIDGKDAMTIGGRAAWIANHHFALGVAGRGFFNNFNTTGYYNSNYDPDYNEEYSLAGGYGGLLLEPILVPMSPVNVSFPIVVGAGGVTAMPTNWNNYNYYDTYYYNTTAFFLAEAGVDVQFNITKFFRVAVGGSYRYTSDVYLQYQYYDENDKIQYTNVPKDALRGFNFDLSLKFGWF